MRIIIVALCFICFVFLAIIIVMMAVPFILLCEATGNIKKFNSLADDIGISIRDCVKKYIKGGE